MESKRVFFVAHLLSFYLHLFLKLNSVTSASPLFLLSETSDFFFQRSFRLTCICGHDANEHSQQRIDGPA